ncbi:ABC transporter substrate-binding protein [Tychonema sp. LEGE 07203]|uniref:ABC transporter substrate-binding protein n=1 Tax=Tychonema sp. LEGE 07203 TaxID=1828671 RepID=UPI00187F9BD0|nr:ABC transporter substrate-binding protein [Tychonema sp. LEGE 07203]MBE9095028.1 amino acid ABC transporter substrate-binding protein [Tychonema sp. LEGE 07203]
MTWSCDGVPKYNPDQYSSSPHSTYDNDGQICMMCGLPKEAVVSPGNGGSGKKLPIKQILMGVAAVLVVGGGGFGLYKAFSGKPSDSSVTAADATSTSTPATVVSPGEFLSSKAVSAPLISQGEKILLTGGKADAEKQAGAAAFVGKNWDEAIAKYEAATKTDPNDPETKIYLNNAAAQKTGNPLTIAVVVPIGASADAAKEVLRGAALYQEQFNKSPTVPGRLLEIVIVNDEVGKTVSIAQDLVNSPNVLGVLGHGIDSSSQDAIKTYETAGLAAISPVSSSVSIDSSNKATLKLTKVLEKTDEMLKAYLQKVGETVANYANKNHSPGAIAIFYNSDSVYSKQLKELLVLEVPKASGKIVKEVDIKAGGTFDAKSAVADASQAGANVVFMATSKDQVEQAIAIAIANKDISPPLALMGGSELYNPTTLVKGEDAIKDLVLAVPWRWEKDDPFSKEASEIWKGRVSWRTATAFDATQALTAAITSNPTREGTVKFLTAGTLISGTAKEFDLLKEIPLVKAVEGKDGPPGSKYQFDAIQ